QKNPSTRISGWIDPGAPRTMKVPKEKRAEHFELVAKQIILEYGIKFSLKSEYVDGLRVATLFSEELVKMYGAMIGQDAFIVLRDWAHAKKLCCIELRSRERRKNGDLKRNPFHNPMVRVYANLDFLKYIRILE